MPSRCDLILAAASQSILFFFLIFLWFNFTSLWVANMCLLHKGWWTSCLLPSSSSSKETCTHRGTGMENNPLCCLNANTSAFAAMRSCTQLQQQARSYSKRHRNQGNAKRRLETGELPLRGLLLKLLEKTEWRLLLWDPEKEAITLKLLLTKTIQFRLDLFFFLWAERRKLRHDLMTTHCAFTGREAACRVRSTTITVLGKHRELTRSFQAMFA